VWGKPGDAPPRISSALLQGPERELQQKLKDGETRDGCLQHFKKETKTVI